VAPENRISSLLVLLTCLGLLWACAGDGPDSAKGPDSPGNGCDVDPSDHDEGILSDFDPLSVPEDRAHFPLPVQAGAMREDEVFLTAYTTEPETARLYVWRPADLPGEIVLVREEDLASETGFFKVKVDNLAPKTEYHYAFFQVENDSLSARSVVGTFRTALPEDCAEPVVVAGTHGTNRKHKPFSALQITARYDIDVFVQLGDYSYNDGANTLSEFRSMWHTTVDDVGYWELLPAVGQYIVWDDHEFRDNSSYYADVETAAFQAAKDAFFERNPVPRFDKDTYWTSYRWGKTVEFFALDCRSERIYGIPELQLGSVRYISEDQMEWLKGGLLDSPCHFKVLLNSVPLTNFPGLWDLAAMDRWEGFAPQRTELLDYIVEKGIDNVWALSGDFHTGSLSTVEAGPPWNAIREVLMGPGGNLGNPMWFFYDALGRPEEVAPSNQFDFFYGLPSATIMTFDPSDGSVSLLFIEAESEEVLFDRTVY
jgi:phosphodiesterase/alkaline phosphatase D-like protein